MHTKTIKELKQLTLNETAHFSSCLNYFLDLAEDPQFMTDGEKLSHPSEFFEALLQPIAAFFKSRIEKDSFFLIQVKKHHLIHGSVKLSNHRLVMLYYFEDIQSGIAGTGILGKGDNHFFRLTLKGSGLQTSSPVLH